MEVPHGVRDIQCPTYRPAQRASFSPAPGQWMSQAHMPPILFTCFLGPLVGPLFVSQEADTKMTFSVRGFYRGNPYNASMTVVKGQRKEGWMETP